MRFRNAMLLLLATLLPSCAYTLDGLKVDELSELRPNECPAVEGWFYPVGVVRSSSGLYHMPVNLPDLLSFLGIKEYSGFRFNKKAMAQQPVFLKITSQGIEGTVFNEKGAKEPFHFRYGENKPDFIGEFPDRHQYCSQGKLLVRYSWNLSHPESRTYHETDAVFRPDKDGLRVVVQDYQNRHTSFIFQFHTTHTESAEILFKPASAPPEGK